MKTTNHLSPICLMLLIAATPAAARADHPATTVKLRSPASATDPCHASTESATFVNPIAAGADPWIVRHQGKYVLCAADGNRGIALYESDRLHELGPRHVIWSAPPTGPCSQEVWAPELHHLDGRWYVYFAASNGENRNHRVYVLESSGDDPYGPYTLHGPVYTGDSPATQTDNRWAIDATVLETDGVRYLVWSGWERDADVQFLYIARLKRPWETDTPRVKICANNDYLWERVDENEQGRGLLEGPEVLKHDGRTFLIYSCSGSWQTSYKLGLLELQPGGDPLDPRSWRKHSRPVFAPTSRVLGVGHSSFTKSPDGTEDWIVFHCKLDRRDGWRRAVLIQPFHWTEAGFPDFGDPLPPGQAIPVPSGTPTGRSTGPVRRTFDSFGSLDDWLYFGHPTMVSLRDGRLSLGTTSQEPDPGYRTGEKVLLRDACWSDLRVDAGLRIVSGQRDAGILFRVRHPALGYDAQQGYFAGLIPQSQTVVLGSTDGKRWRHIADAPVPIQVGKDYRLRVTARGDSISVFLDGQRVLSARDRAHRSGTVGLRVVDTEAAFSGFQVIPL